MMRYCKIKVVLNAGWICLLLFAAGSAGVEGGSNDERQGILAGLRRGSDGKTPTVKNFEEEWVATLDQRGEPIVYTRENSKNFEYIGMPVGGIGAGLLYLGGDGKLWGWDIFNTKGSGHCRGENGYRSPYTRSDTNCPAYHVLDQGFAVRFEQDGMKKVKTLDRDGFRDIEFRGEYPVGLVRYSDPECPVAVELEVFSPFCPGNIDDSSYPATILNYTVRNTSDRAVSGELVGWLENAVCIESGRERAGVLMRRNRVVSGKGSIVVDYSCVLKEKPADSGIRPEILFDDFESEKYKDWTVDGTAFGEGPVRRDDLPHYLAGSYFSGKGFVCSHNTRKGEGVGEADAHQGAMLSREFVIERRLIGYMIGGGNQADRACINLLVDGNVVRTATGKNSNNLQQEYFDVSDLQGRKAQLQILDQIGGSWATIFIDNITFCDEKSENDDDWLKSRVDYGSMAFAVVGDDQVSVSAGYDVSSGVIRSDAGAVDVDAAAKAPVGALAKAFKLKPGRGVTVSYVLAWYFPAYRGVVLRTITDRGYGERFGSAREVAEHVVSNMDRLTSQTRVWHDAWYDSTLPWWFLDRTFINTCILSANTSYVFKGGRFFGFEGEYLGQGTCTHVWGYVQALGRLFPVLERSLREQVDYNPKVGFDGNTGGVAQRGEYCMDPADDGQCSVILRTLLVHQMQADNEFLKGIYPNMKKAMNFLVNDQDPNRIGMMTRDQMCTLDARWYGMITWHSLYYQSALRAAAEMADVMGDRESAVEWRIIADRGRKYIEDNLYNGEYFIHIPDPAHPESPGSFDGCEIDQLLGQSWAYQVGLGRIIDPVKAKSALESMWRYNFTTDVGPYREKFQNGRWYAMPGEGGLLICSWPRGGTDVMKKGVQHFAGYLNECMPGFEYALSSLMMWDGMPYHSLAHTRIMHERFHGSKRNPWNEVEWGSFYSRSMASYGVFVSACGFEYDGPKGRIGFSPRITPENFKAAFTAAEGWGTYSQKVEKGRITAEINVRHGQLRLETITLGLMDNIKPGSIQVRVGKKVVDSTFEVQADKLVIKLADKAVVKKDETLVIRQKQ